MPLTNQRMEMDIHAEFTLSGSPVRRFALEDLRISTFIDQSGTEHLAIRIDSRNQDAPGGSLATFSEFTSQWKLMPVQTARTC